MGAIAAPAVAGLTEVGTRPRLGGYLAETWRLRAFAVRLAGSRLISGLLPNRLGVLWIVLKPLSLAITYGVIFHFILSGAARPENYVQFLLVGVFVFEFFTGCFGSGSKSITSNSKLVQSFGFPRILLPISVIAEQAMRMVPVVLMLGILLLILGEPIAWSWLLVIPILAVMGVFNLGVALVVSRISVRTRDVQQLVPIISRVLFYASGIFFDLDGALADLPTLLTIVHLNPIYEFIAIARDVLLEGYAAPLLAWIAAPIWALVMIVGGVIYFWRAEPRYGLSD
ncbi:ABC transporter permease [uncultured Microbacterium sp.]|uniref:ABC transporter permease n=1 Tax=uncultured Microbacterium sp. TaxID=191216 RepID=UPI0025FEF131|nr:ABC transporter permease [uncultured Microbacterium sp.]